MSERDSNLPPLLPNLAIILLVAIGFLNRHDPLFSARPAGGAETLPTIEERYAHLWQDPFDVKPPPRLAPAPEGLLRAELRADARQKRAALDERQAPDSVPRNLRVLVLPVLLNPTNDPNTAEARLRTRYAVVSALGRAQYLPERHDRLRFLELGAGGPVVPFESFDVRYLVADHVVMPGNENYWDRPARPSTAPPHDADGKAEAARTLEIDRPYDEVIVCWLDQRAAIPPDQAMPVFSATISHLVTALLGSTAWADDQRNLALGPAFPSPADPALPPVHWDLKVLGPTDTDHLVSLLESAPAAPPTTPAPLELLSYRATAADDVLKISLTHRPEFRSTNISSLAGADGRSWRVTRTIAPDDRLVTLLLDELARRHATPDPTHHLVLIGEWDTLYSRGLARTFAAQLNAAGGPDPLDHRATWSGNPDYLHEFSYLQGLDGEPADPEGQSAGPKPKRPSPGETGGKDSTGKDDADKSAQLERADGPSQYDYLRRLAAEVTHLQARLAAQKPAARIGAIGIVTSDNYDKLLVLRALRTSFPETVFFTTDFDALYLNREERRWTGNLIVASSFGLQAHPVLQDRIPPFRDGYQTALFLTVLQAVGVDRVGGRPFTLDARTIEPRLFAIGRTDTFDLSPAGYAFHPPLHPPRAPYTALSWWLLPPTILLLLTWLFWTVGWKNFYLVLTALVWLASVEGAIVGASRLLTMCHAPGAAVSVPWLGSAALADETVGKSALLFLIGFAMLGVFVPCSRLWFVPLKSKSPGEIWRDNLRDETGGGRRRSFFRTSPTGRVLLLALFVLLTLGGCGCLYLSMNRIAAGWAEEPFAMFEGVSVWPTEAIRIAASFLAIVGMAMAQFRLDRMKRDVRRHCFGIVTPTPGALPEYGHRQPTWKETRIFRIYRAILASETAAPPSTTGGKRPSHWRLRRRYWRRWGLPSWWLAERRRMREFSAWVRYELLTGRERRTGRLLFCVAVYTVALLIFAATTQGVECALLSRGNWSHALEQGIFLSSCFIYCLLLFFVFDATALAAGLIDKFTRYVGGVSHLNEVDSLHVLTAVTNAVSGLVYLPFTMLLLMIVARNRLFDTWGWNPVVVAGYGSGLVLIVLTSLLLQGRARTCRQRTLEYFDRRIADLLKQKRDRPKNAPAPAPPAGQARAAEDAPPPAGPRGEGNAGPPTAAPPPDHRGDRTAGPQPAPDPRPDNETMDAAIELLEERREQVRDLTSPIFGGWHQNPIFRAILIPLGGLGSLQLLDYFGRLWTQ